MNRCYPSKVLLGAKSIVIPQCVPPHEVMLGDKPLHYYQGPASMDISPGHVSDVA